MNLGAQRKTGQRAAIREVLDVAAGPMSAPELLAAAQESVPGLGIATVYRNLRLLADEGALHPVELPGQPVRYEIAGRDHHHHFHCDSCGRVYDIDGCFQEIEKRIPEGFEVSHHELVLYGRCAQCGSSAAP